ncbi:ATPase [Solibacillus sp. FSL H8-0523]|uniref:ATPase n=1 Tax=Solibacillus sp. FSL H8-0523 TaxID=2954511 RepID=UPI0031010E8F
MYKKIMKEDCLFLISDEKFSSFQRLMDQLDLFSLTLPFVSDTYQRTVSILDIWYLISTNPKERIDHPENRMIYPYRLYFLTMINDVQMKRYVQLAVYDNEKLAFICAIYLYKGLNEFISEKMSQNEEVHTSFKLFQQYNQKSIRPYYDEKYIELEDYPKQLALLQATLETELRFIHQQYKSALDDVYTNAIEEATDVYEVVFGLINDWGGLVT